MALENLVGSNVFITNLVPSNPAPTDPVSEGDNHIAGTKNVLLNSFPAINGAVTATPAQLNQLSPVGGAEFTGIPTAPTAAPGTNTTQIASTAFAKAAADAAAAAGLGAAQTWQNLTAQRAKDTTYTNNTGKPISVSITTEDTSNRVDLRLTVGGIVIANTSFSGGGNNRATVSGIVPNGATYSIAMGVDDVIQVWAELR